MNGITEIINSLAERITSSASSVAAVVAIAVLTVMGVWYMIADAQEATKIKSRFYKVAIGLIIVQFAAAIVDFFMLGGGNM